MPVAVTVIQAPSPSVAGVFTSQPLGFLLHGSRSGITRPEADEWASTVRYAVAGGGPDGLSWHVTAMSGKVAVHMRPVQWGWSAYEASKLYIAVEFAQARLGDPIPDASIDAFCWYIRKHVLPVWPTIPRLFVCHSELQAEKSDPVVRAEADAFNARVAGRLAQFGG